MKAWQNFVSEHHDIEVVNDDKVIVKDVIYNTITKASSDDVVTKVENGYIDKNGNKYNTIKEYLGY